MQHEAIQSDIVSLTIQHSLNSLWLVSTILKIVTVYDELQCQQNCWISVILVREGAKNISSYRFGPPPPKLLNIETYIFENVQIYAILY